MKRSAKHGERQHLTIAVRRGRGAFLAAALLLLLAGCAASRPAAPPPEAPPPAAPPPATPAASGMARAPTPISALPAVPAQNGPLAIDLAYPRLGAAKPSADSTFLFGSVGTGAAELTINGLRVPVAANGAFLAFVPVPAEGRYVMTARAGEETAREVFVYGQQRTVEAAEPLSVPRVGTVISGRDTLAAASQIVAASKTPGGDRFLFLPRGARLTVTARLGDDWRVRLAEGVEAWLPVTTVELGEQAGAGASPVGAPSLHPAARYVDLRLPVAFAPFHIEAHEKTVSVTIYGRTAPPSAPAFAEDPFVAGAGWAASAADSARLTVQLARPLWGFKAFYDEEGALVVRLRRPPAVHADDPLRGLLVMVDAGHPPGGAIGPTGLTEAEANLAIAERLAAMLRARGAEVVMSRTSAAPLENATDVADELWARVDLAVATNADLLVSVHNNAFPDGINPFERYGTETYYFHPFAAGLARALVDEIAGVTGLPNLGAKQRSLALVRPTWMPSTLTESLFMMFPQQEAALRDPAFLDRLAAAHLRGLEAFVRARL